MPKFYYVTQINPDTFQKESHTTLVTFVRYFISTLHFATAQEQMEFVTDYGYSEAFPRWSREELIDFLLKFNPPPHLATTAAQASLAVAAGLAIPSSPAGPPTTMSPPPAATNAGSS